MGTAVDDLGSNSFLVLLSEGAKGPGPKAEALEALSLRTVWLATWEPRAEGFRTLINANGEEALAVFSSEKQLQAAAARFGWLAEDGTVATHHAIGGDILRHAWTREYTFVVVDVGSDHALEYDRDELKRILRELDSTGPFRTSRPPPPTGKATASSSFPPPVEPISTMYSMTPHDAEQLDRLSSLPTKPYEALQDREPPTEPRAGVGEAGPAPAKPASSPPAKKPESNRPATRIEEVQVKAAEHGDMGTYGAASIVPPSRRRPKPASTTKSEQEDLALGDSSHPAASSAPKLNSEAPTAPGAQGFASTHPGKLRLPPIGPIGTAPVEPEPPPVKAARGRGQEPADQAVNPPTRADEAAAAGPEKPVGKRDNVQPEKPPRPVATSIGDGIRLAPLHEAPDEELLASLAEVMRGYFEIEWASYCQVVRPAGPPSPAVALRITDNYRDNVTAIIRDLCEASRKHHTEMDVLLIDGHDMLRKARESAFVFYPWKPKPFQS
jgi:hypothetical protein